MKSVMPLIAVGALAAFSATATAEVAPDAVQIVEMEVATPLSDAPGDPANGRKVLAARGLGNCLACHAVTDMSGEQFHGDVGPTLDGAGSRWTESQLRAIIVNSKAVFGEQTVMPAFYKSSGFLRMRKDVEGKSILTAQEVEDVVAYLLTLED